MNNKVQITASIVTYKNDPQILQKAIKSILDTNLNLRLLIVDNSPTSELKEIVQTELAEYIHNSYNIGFGAAHNIAMKRAFNLKSKYHLVINPDISFDPGTIESIIDFMDLNIDVALLMPKIIYPNGTIQYLPKLLPDPFDLLVRRLRFLRRIFYKKLQKYELRQFLDSTIFDAPIISGCFSCFRIKSLQITGLYDERFFMYFEDFDLSRRIKKLFRTIYYPDVHVFHEYERGAAKSFILFKIYFQSAIKYFNKWGWFFDKERVAFNKAALNKIK